MEFAQCLMSIHKSLLEKRMLEPVKFFSVFLYTRERVHHIIVPVEKQNRQILKYKDEFSMKANKDSLTYLVVRLIPHCYQHFILDIESLAKSVKYICTYVV